MKNRVVAMAPVVVVLASLALLGCGDDGSAPNTPAAPYPGANAKDVAVDTVLAWECTDPDGNELTYDVYLGTDNNPPCVAEGISPPYYSPAENLAGDTTYYWKIVAKDGSNATGGPTWSFTTTSAGGGGGGGETKTGYAHFMPLNVGNKWVYEYIYSYKGTVSERDEYELLVVDKFDNYHGFEAYLVKCKWLYEIPHVTYIALGYDGNECYLFTCPWWEFLVGDKIAWKGWAQTGLFTYYKLQYNDVRNISVPAGYFENCKQMGLAHKEGNNTFTYEECYAKDVGLVYHRSHRNYGSYSYTDEYKLKSYKVTPP